MILRPVLLSCLAISNPILSASVQNACYDFDTQTINYTPSTADRVTTTVSGIECQRWDTASPNDMDPALLSKLKEGKDNNYCQNPDNDKGGPWCYKSTTAGNVFAKPKESNWESCGIPDCLTGFSAGSSAKTVTVRKEQTCINKQKTGDIEDTYYGTETITRSGFKCQNWNLDAPNIRSNYIKSILPKDINHNYCRNFDKEVHPWCYSTNPSVPWEYCDIPYCEQEAAKANLDTDGSELEIECGVSCDCGDICDPSNSCNIVSGKQAHMTQFPWQAHIRQKNGQYNKINAETGEPTGITHAGFCGGSVINRNFILTAAHCFVGDSFRSQPANIIVAVGYARVTNEKDSFSEKYGQNIYDVRRIITHPEFTRKDQQFLASDETFHQHDIALVQLARSIKYPITKQSIADGTNYLYTLVRPVCLPGVTKKDLDAGFKHSDNKFEKNLQTDAFGDRAFISGFGRVGGTGEAKIEDRSESQVLLYANIHRVTAKTCINSSFLNGRSSLPLRIKKFATDTSQICGADNSPTSSAMTCNGDSGGPMTAQSTIEEYKSKTIKTKQRHALIGITSFGSAKCNNGMSVYTRVSNYIDWIQQYTNDLQILGGNL